MEKLIFEHKIMDFGKFSKVMENTELRFEENNFELKDFLKSMEEMSVPKQIDTTPTASEDGTNQKLDDVILDDLENIDKAQGTANKGASTSGTSASTTPATPETSTEPKSDDDKAQKAQEPEKKEDKAQDSAQKDEPKEDKAQEPAQKEEKSEEKKYNFQK